MNAEDLQAAITAIRELVAATQAEREGLLIEFSQAADAGDTGAIRAIKETARTIPKELVALEIKLAALEIQQEEARMPELEAEVLRRGEIVAGHWEREQAARLEHGKAVYEESLARQAREDSRRHLRALKDKQAALKEQAEAGAAGAAGKAGQAPGSGADPGADRQ
jgi:hypothetical protein